jgi:hypothetical protein
MLLTFANDFFGGMPLQHSDTPRHSMFYKNNQRYFNFGQLRRHALLKDADLLICPSYRGGSSWPTFIVGVGSNASDLAAIDQASTLTVFATYNVRPAVSIGPEHSALPIDFGLTPVRTVGNRAITSESFYLMYGAQGDAFHNFEGVLAGYGDGSVRWVDGRTSFITIARNQNSNAVYWNDSNGDGHPETGLWAELDHP